MTGIPAATAIASLSDLPASVYWLALAFVVPGAVHVLLPSVAGAVWDRYYEIRAFLRNRGYLWDFGPQPSNKYGDSRQCRIIGLVFIAIGIAIIWAAARFSR